MTYFYSRQVELSFADAVERARFALQQAGFGVLTEIDVRATLKTKIGEDFRPYVILGACNPSMALEALTMEPHVGVMLPCNVVVQQRGDGVEIFAVDPVATMAAIDNPALLAHAERVGAGLREAVDAAAF